MDALALRHDCFKIHGDAHTHCQRQRCSPRSVLSGDIRLMSIFVGVRWWGGVSGQKHLNFRTKISCHGHKIWFDIQHLFPEPREGCDILCEGVESCRCCKPLQVRFKFLCGSTRSHIERTTDTNSGETNQYYGFCKPRATYCIVLIQPLAAVLNNQLRILLSSLLTACVAVSYWKSSSARNSHAPAWFPS